MAYLDMDTDTLRSLVTTAERTNATITEAANLLNQIQIHEDWKCNEKKMIDQYTGMNRMTAQQIQSNTSSFYQAVKRSSELFDETEQEIIAQSSQVNELLGQIRSVVPGLSGSAAPAITSFGDLNLGE